MPIEVPTEVPRGAYRGAMQGRVHQQQQSGVCDAMSGMVHTIFEAPVLRRAGCMHARSGADGEEHLFWPHGDAAAERGEPGQPAEDTHARRPRAAGAPLPPYLACPVLAPPQPCASQRTACDMNPLVHALMRLQTYVSCVKLCKLSAWVAAHANAAYHACCADELFRKVIIRGHWGCRESGRT